MVMPRKQALSKGTPATTSLKRSTAAPSKAAATRPQTAPAQSQASTPNLPAVPKELALQFAEDALENMANVHDAFFRVSIRGGRFKVGNDLIGNEGISFEAIILRETPVNIFYISKYDEANPVNPDCWSLGGMEPDVACEKIQNDSCVTCVNNRFGTGTDQEGKRSRGKACRNARRLVLKVEGVDFPVLMSLPPTTIKPFNQYLKMLTSNVPPVPMFAVKTHFEFDTTAQYPKPQMEFKEMLSAADYLNIREYRISAEVESALNAYASPSDIAADGEETEVAAQTRMEKGEGRKEAF